MPHTKKSNGPIRQDKTNRSDMWTHTPRPGQHLTNSSSVATITAGKGLWASKTNTRLDASHDFGKRPQPSTTPPPSYRHKFLINNHRITLSSCTASQPQKTRLLQKLQPNFLRTTTMSAKYYQVEGPLGDYYQATGFSHAVVLPANSQLVIAAGQPGLGAQAQISASPEEQIEACFDNCDKALKAAGVKEGLWKAHKVHAWLLDVSQEPLMMEIWRRKWPAHRPTWMCIGTNALCGPGMIIELQVEAHIAPGQTLL